MESNQMLHSTGARGAAAMVMNAGSAKDPPHPEAMWQLIKRVANLDVYKTVIDVDDGRTVLSIGIAIVEGQFCCVGIYCCCDPRSGRNQGFLKF